jgi:hypothetical protein
MADTNSSTESERLNIAAQTRALEIGLFWQRSLFFWGFIIAVGAGFIETYDEAPTLGTVLACFGAICALAWSLVNRGSKYWQENWESKAEEAAIGYLGEPLFGRPEPIHRPTWLGAKRFSVTDLTAGLSDFVCIGWTVAAGHQLWSIFDNPKSSTASVVVNISIIIISFGYAVSLFFRSRRFDATTLYRYASGDAAKEDQKILRDKGIAAQIQAVRPHARDVAAFGFLLMVMKNDLEKASELLPLHSNPARLPPAGRSPGKELGAGPRSR